MSPRVSQTINYKMSKPWRRILRLRNKMNKMVMMISKWQWLRKISRMTSNKGIKIRRGIGIKNKAKAAKVKAKARNLMPTLLMLIGCTHSSANTSNQHKPKECSLKFSTR